MIFHSPDTLYLVITVFFVVAAASVVLAFATLRLALRTPQATGPVVRMAPRQTAPASARAA